jgi:hypothetical protein
VLVEKKDLAGEIVSLKLTSGDELVAKLVEETLTEVKIENPIAVAMAPTGGVALIPFMLGIAEKSTLTLKKTDVLVLTKTRRELENAFIEQTTGLQTTSSGFDPNAQPAAPTFGGGRGSRGGLVQS